MSNVNKIIAKLHKPKTRIELGKVQDVIREYESYYPEHESVVNQLVGHISAIDALTNELLSINYALEEVYFNTKDIVLEAQDLGLDVTTLPDKITDILDLDAMAGLNRVQGNAIKLYEAVQGLSRDSFEYI